jgi:hypothetical protein
MAATVEQPSLFDLPETTTTTTEPVPQPPLNGTATWRLLTRRGECVDCWADQAAAHDAGQLPPRREAARVEMAAGPDHVELCERHAWRRGWPGRTRKTRR